MSRLLFEWNAEKNLKNYHKHGISFEEARTAFDDKKALRFYDEAHSSHETRFLLLGISDGAGMIIVSHCYRSRGSVIRIISARKASTREMETYKEKNT